MATLTPIAQSRGSHDLFFESTDSVSVSWKDGGCVIRRGLREGAGVRWRDRSGAVQFRSLDDPTRERISTALVEMGGHQASRRPDMDSIHAGRRLDADWRLARRRLNADRRPEGRRPGIANED